MSKFEKELVKNMNSGKIPWESDPTSYYMVSKPALELIFRDQKPPKQIVTVPKFVAEWYEKMITGTFSAVISSYAFNPEFDSVKWVNENGGMNVLCKMFLYGYTVKEEKLYRVVLLKDERNDEWILFKNSKGHFVDYASNNDGFWQQHFTEREIKANDERYWPFAVPVDEVTEK